MTGLTWSTLSAGNPSVPVAPSRRPLRVKPILLYSTYTPRPQTSWRNWGGIETQEQADAEVVRIRGELKQMKAKADFPIEYLPVSAIRGPGDLLGTQQHGFFSKLRAVNLIHDLDTIAKARQEAQDIYKEGSFQPLMAEVERRFGDVLKWLRV